MIILFIFLLIVLVIILLFVFCSLKLSSYISQISQNFEGRDGDTNEK